MSRTDLIADSLTIIRNAVRARKEEVVLPYSKMLIWILEILKSQDYVENFKEVDLENRKQIKVYLKYNGKKNAITQIKRISKPGRRVYLSCKDIPRILQGYGVAIVSTSSGVITDNQARRKGLGGEIIAAVW